jgi:hypothetical protein
MVVVRLAWQPGVAGLRMQSLEAVFEASELSSGRAGMFVGL